MNDPNEKLNELMEDLIVGEDSQINEDYTDVE